MTQQTKNATRLKLFRPHFLPLGKHHPKLLISCHQRRR